MTNQMTKPDFRRPHLRTIIIDPSPGTIFSDVAHAAQHIADDLECDAKFSFNGWSCVAKRGGSADVLIARYEAERQLPTIYQLRCITSDGTSCPPKSTCTPSNEGTTQ